MIDEKTGGEFTDKIDIVEEKIGYVIEDQAAESDA